MACNDYLSFIERMCRKPKPKAMSKTNQNTNCAASSPRHSPKRPFVLGIETSCDETAAAIVSADRQILSHALISQIDEHIEFGGVVPEIAARSHITYLPWLVQKALDEASMDVGDLDAIAATTGPGLVGGLMVGMLTAKAMAQASDKPFIAVNHLEGHALTARLIDDTAFPFLLLLVSGGHCQLLEVSGVGLYNRLGTTIDDAVGEAFDKTAKLLGLDYPGGPAVEKAAALGNPRRFKLPRPLTSKAGCNFSFSGLKTAVRRIAEDCANKRGALYREDVADICAAFQVAVGDCLIDRTTHAIMQFRENHDEPLPALVVAGGVAANQYLRGRLSTLAREQNFKFVTPPVPLCTDNAAMIAWAGLERFAIDPKLNDKDIACRPRWPLDSHAKGLSGSGKKGAKA